ncbi:MAG: hypothetical protein L3J59_02450 [Methylococcaceae bacterium]|nr:hypothetical protein [Methylococcaceae bacterium]
MKAGAVYTYKGTNTTLEPLEKIEPPATAAGGLITYRTFGSSLATGKFPGATDGNMEFSDLVDENAEWLVIGDPTADFTDYEVGNYHLGGNINIFAYQKHYSSFKSPVYETAGPSLPDEGYYSYEILVYDSQLVVGAPAEFRYDQSHMGAVYTSHPFNNFSTSRRLDVDESHDGITNNGGSGFGVSLAAGNFSGGADQQQVVGAPSATYMGGEKSGWAFVFENSSTTSLYSFGQ